MATEHTRPTTLSGVKRLAKFLKHERGIPHHSALNEAAKKAGFENLRHAQSALGASTSNLHRAFVSFYWTERADNRGRKDGPVVRRGRTTFEFLLPVPLAELLPGRSLERTPYLDDFRLESPDHLERRSDFYDEREGVRMAKSAALALNFMAVTGLRAPLASELYRPYIKLSENADHRSHWYDEGSNGVVILDEPYLFLFKDEIAWAKEHGFHTLGVRWRGLYLAGYTPRLHSTSAEALTRLAGQLEALEARLSGDERWTCSSHPYESQFISPARVISGKRKPPRIMPTPQGVERKGAVPCGPGLPGHQSSWRPARRMDLEKHLHIGPIMSSLTISVGCAWSGAHVGQIGSTLHTWFRFEYEDSELPDKQSRRIYDLRKPTYIKGTANQLTALAEVRQVIVDGYQDCKPKRELLNDIDKADRWIRRNMEQLDAWGR